MIKEIYITSDNNGEFIESSTSSTYDFIIADEYLGEPNRFIFKHNLTIKNTTIDLRGWEFNSIPLEINQSFYWNHQIKFLISGKSPKGEKFEEEFIGAYLPRRISESSENGTLAVVLAIYLMVLTHDTQVAKEIYSNICTPYFIPRNVDFLEFNISSLSRIINSVQIINKIIAESDFEKKFHNYLLKIYQLGFDNYFNNIKEINDKMLQNTF